MVIVLCVMVGSGSEGERRDGDQKPAKQNNFPSIMVQAMHNDLHSYVEGVYDPRIQMIQRIFVLMYVGPLAAMQN